MVDDAVNEMMHCIQSVVTGYRISVLTEQVIAAFCFTIMTFSCTLHVQIVREIVAVAFLFIYFYHFVTLFVDEKI